MDAPPAVRLVCDPDQPVEVIRALEGLLAVGRSPVDPWWRAGLDESLHVSVPAPQPLHSSDVHSVW